LFLGFRTGVRPAFCAEFFLRQARKTGDLPIKLAELPPPASCAWNPFGRLLVIVSINLKVVKGINMKATLAYVLLLATVATATAQKVENDDLYFTSKDRAKLREAAPVMAKNSQTKADRNNEVAEKAQAPDTGLNPTDSYSARNVNPEYTTKGSASKGTSKADYFVEDYTPTGVNDKLGNRYANNSYSGGNNPYSVYSPYSSPYSYGSPYNSFGNMGWGTSMSMGMGGMYGMYPGMMSMSYGMGYGSMYNPWMMGGMGYGYGGYSSMYNPYMYDPFMSMYNPYSFYGYSNYGYNSYGYPGGYGGGAVVVSHDPNNGRTVTHSRRTDRSSSESYVNDGTRSTTTAQTTRTGRTIAGGRTRSAEQTEAYYQRGWRNNTATNGQSANRSNWSNNGYAPSQNSGSAGNHNNAGRSSWSGWDNSGSSSHNGSSWSGGSSSPSRSSWGGSGGGFSGGGGGHTSSGGAHRGRD
jgi:hypothetical protein